MPTHCLSTGKKNGMAAAGKFRCTCSDFCIKGLRLIRNICFVSGSNPITPMSVITLSGPPGGCPAVGRGMVHDPEIYHGQGDIFRF